MVEKIKARLNELDRRESQILFSASFLSREDREQLNEIHAEQRRLNEKLKELSE